MCSGASRPTFPLSALHCIRSHSVHWQNIRMAEWQKRIAANVTFANALRKKNAPFRHVANSANGRFGTMALYHTSKSFPPRKATASLQPENRPKKAARHHFAHSQGYHSGPPKTFAPRLFAGRGSLHWTCQPTHLIAPLWGWAKPSCCGGLCNVQWKKSHPRLDCAHCKAP